MPILHSKAVESLLRMKIPRQSILFPTKGWRWSLSKKSAHCFCYITHPSSKSTNHSCIDFRMLCSFRVLFHVDSWLLFYTPHVKQVLWDFEWIIFSEYHLETESDLWKYKVFAGNSHLLIQQTSTTIRPEIQIMNIKYNVRKNSLCFNSLFTLIKLRLLIKLKNYTWNLLLKITQHMSMTRESPNVYQNDCDKIRYLKQNITSNYSLTWNSLYTFHSASTVKSKYFAFVEKGAQKTFSLSPQSSLQNGE